MNVIKLRTNKKLEGKKVHIVWKIFIKNYSVHYKIINIITIRLHSFPAPSAVLFTQYSSTNSFIHCSFEIYTDVGKYECNLRVTFCYDGGCGLISFRFWSRMEQLMIREIVVADMFALLISSLWARKHSFWDCLSEKFTSFLWSSF